MAAISEMFVLFTGTLIYGLTPILVHPYFGAKLILNPL